MVRFLHSSDWQLGMTRHFLAQDAQARFSQARLEAIEEMSRIAAENECEFVVVAGDVFESNLVDRKTVSCLREADPELKKERLESARADLTRVTGDLSRKEKEHVAINAGLERSGDDGLFEKVEEARAAWNRAAADSERLHARARAAKLLHDTFHEERAKARERYVAPIKNCIERLGSNVFGSSFTVEIDGASLAVRSRTVDGSTVNFDSLSGGAREQIGLIMRLACAMIVSGNGGVPLIFDDALGSSDPERLERMCAVLQLAARETQVIVLTCSPERFRRVGEVRVVDLP